MQLVLDLVSTAERSAAQKKRSDIPAGGWNDWSLRNSDLGTG